MILTLLLFVGCPLWGRELSPEEKTPSALPLTLEEACLCGRVFFAPKAESRSSVHENERGHTHTVHLKHSCTTLRAKENPGNCGVLRVLGNVGM